MVGIVSGSSVGLGNTSLGVLGSGGVVGNAALGIGGGIYVNAANGNLVVQGRDELLMGRGPDALLLRTYNNQGQMADDNGDNWRLGFSRKVTNTGGLNVNGSIAKRVDEDGSETTYLYSTAKGLYVSTMGGGAFDTLSYNAGKWTWTDGDTRRTESYDKNNGGRLTEVADPDGNKLAVHYNAAGLVDWITTANGETTYIDYDTTAGKTSNILQLRTVTGGVTTIRTQYRYDAANRLTYVITDLTPRNAADNTPDAWDDTPQTIAGKSYVTAYTYNGANGKRLMSLTQPDGSRLDFTYTDMGGGVFGVKTVTETRGTDVRVTTLNYDPAVRKTTVQDATGQTTELTYDTNGQLLSVKAPPVNGIAQELSFSYDPDISRFGNVLTVTDARGQITTYEYDAWGNRTLERDSAGNTITRVYGDGTSADRPLNQLLVETRYTVSAPALPSGALSSRYVYDNKGHLRFSVNAQGGVTEYKYDGSGQLTARIRYTGNSYNLAGLGTTDPLTETGLKDVWLPTVNKQLAERIDYGYDFRGQISSQTAYAQLSAIGDGLTAGALTTQYVYSPDGQLLQVIDPRGVATTGIADDYVTTYSYDGLGRQLTMQDAAGVLTVSSYDDLGHKTTVKLSNGQTTVTAYNAGGQPVSVTHSNGLAALDPTTYLYDKLDRLRQSTDAAGGKHYYLFDEAGRQTGEIDETGALTEYRYNKNNQLVTTVRYANALSSTTLAQAANDPIAFTLAQAKANLADAANDRSSYSLYNNAGQLTALVDGEGAVTVFAYDGAGRQTQITRYAKALTASQLDALAVTDATRELTLTDIAVNQNDDQNRIERSFYDARGLLIGKLDGEGYLAQYQYDAGGRLVEAIGYANATGAAWRAAGSFAELLSSFNADATQDQHAYTLYNNLGQIEGIVDAEAYLTEWRYDAAGNKTTVIRYSNKVSYTAGVPLGSLRPASDTQDQTASFIYDARNQLARQTGSDGSITIYVYDDLGRQIASTRAVGTNEARSSLVRYDALGRIVQELSGEGAKALAALGVSPTQAQIDEVWSQYGAYAITHSYDAANRRTSSTDALGHKTLFYYDAQGRLTHTINAAGEVLATTYNAFGQAQDTRAYIASITPATLAALNGGANTDAVLLAVLATLQRAGDNTQHLTYTHTGQLKNRTDALGFDTTFAYNAFGELFERLTRLDTAGAYRLDRYTYDKRGLLGASHEDANGIDRGTAAAYDAFGRQIDRIDANGNLWHTEYDRLGRVIRTRDPSNATRYSTYDAHGRVLTQTDALNHTTTFSYDTANRSVTVTTPENIVTTTAANRHGQTLSITDGRGNVTTYDYNADGQLTKVTAPPAQAGDAARTSNTVYNKGGQVFETIDANGIKTVYTYDAAGRVLTRTIDPKETGHPDGLDLTTTYRYDDRHDGLGREVWVQDANLVWTQTLFDAVGHTTEVIVDPKRGPDWNGGPNDHQDGLNLRTVYGYDGVGNVVVKQTAAGSTIESTTRYVYDPLGRVQYEIDATGAVRRYDYNDEGHRTLVTTYANHISLAGLPQAITASDVTNGLTLNPSADSVIRTVFDQNGRAVFSIDGNNALIEQVYDANGNAVETISYDARLASLANYDFDAVRNAAATLGGANRSTHVTYDKDNRVLSRTDALGFVTGYTYDAAGQVLEVAVDPTGLNLRTAYTYDAAGRTLSITEGARSANPRITEYRYDKLGRKTLEIVDPGSAKLNLTTAYIYDALGDIVAKTDALGQVSRFVYDAAARLQYSVDATGAVCRYDYDAAGRQIATTQFADRINLTGLAPAIDETKLLTLLAADTLDVVNRIVFDQNGRAIFAIDGTGALIEQLYDANGNVTSRIAYATRLGALAAYDLDTVRSAADALSLPAKDALTVSTYDTANRLIQSTIQVTVQLSAGTTGTMNVTTRYVYDLAGNLTDTVRGFGTADVSVTHYDYDAAGHLIAETRAYGTAGQAKVQYHLDALGRRIEVIDQLGHSSFSTYDAAGRLIEAKDALGNTITTVYDALGRAVKVTDQLLNSGYFYFDAAGRTVLHIDPEGYAVKTTYDALGNTTQIRRYVTQLASTYNETTTIAALGLSADEAHDAVTQIFHDAVGRQTKIIDAEGYRFNAQGQLLTDVVGHTEYLTYDAFGNKESYTNKLGGKYEYTYDQAGRVKTETLPTEVRSNGQRIVNAFTYDVRGNLITKTEARALSEERVTEFQYDQLDRLIKQTGEEVDLFDPTQPNTIGLKARPTETRRYDARGNLIEINSNGARTLNYYDKLDRKTDTVSPIGGLTSYSYDEAGNVLTETRYVNAISLPAAGAPFLLPLSDVNDRITHYSYDKNGRLRFTKIEGVSVGQRLPDGNYAMGTSDLQTERVWDAAGNLLRETDARNNSIYHFYDKLGRQVAQVDQENYITVWKYGASDKAVSETRHANILDVSNVGAATLAEILQEIDSNNQQDRVTQNDLDRMGRVVETRVLNVATGNLDAEGLLVTGTGIAKTIFEYNGLGQVTKQIVYTGKSTTTGADVTEVSERAYDLIGRQTREQSAGFTNFDGVSANPTTDYEYDGLNNATRQIQRGQDNNSEADDRIDIYTYGAGGRLEQKKDAAGAITYYNYDLSGQITRSRIDRNDANLVDNHVDSTYFFYDAAGHETKRQTWSKVDTAGEPADYVPADLLETRETRYNALGEITGKRTYADIAPTFWQETAEYDKAGRLWKSNAGDGVYKVYRYDANGNSTLTIDSAGLDLGGLSFDAILALQVGQNSQIHITVSQFDKRNKLTGTFEPAMTGSLEQTAIGQFLVNQSGQDYSTGDITVNGPPSPSTLTPINEVVIGGKSGTFQASISLKTEIKKVGNDDHSSWIVGPASSDSLTLNLDTTAWGGGDVIVEFELDKLRGTKSVSGDDDPEIEFGGYKHTFTFFNTTKVTQTIDISETLTSDAISLGALLFTDSPPWTAMWTANRTYHITVKKKMQNNNGEIVLWKKDGTVALTSNTKNSTSGKTTHSVSASAASPKQTIFQNQNPNTKQFVLQYRLVGQSAGWSTKLLGNLKNAANTDVKGWYVLDWSNVASWPRGTYEFCYYALDEAGNVLNSQAGKMILSDSAPSIPPAELEARPINGPGIAFVDTNGKLNFIGQKGADSLKLRYRLADGGWSEPPITADLYINGWFVLDPAQAPSGTNEYLIEGYKAGVLVNRVVGSFAGGSAYALESITGSAQPSTNSMAANLVGTGGTNGDFQANVSLKTEIKKVGNDDHSSWIVGPASSDSLTLNLDTTAWGGGDVIVEFELASLSKKKSVSEDDDPAITFGGYKNTFTFNGSQPISSTIDISESLTAENVGLQALLDNDGYWDSMWTAGRTYTIKVTKKLPNNDSVVLWSTSGTVALTSSTSTSSWTGKTTHSVSKSLASPAHFIFRDQPATATRMILQYRPLGQSSAWSIIEIPQMKGSNGTPIPGWFDFDWSSWPRSNYEFRYVAMESSGKVLNSQAGDFKLSLAQPTFTQAAQPIGGAGYVFQDKSGKLHITQQATAQSIVLKYRQTGTTAWITASGQNSPTPYNPGGGVINGWFTFNPAALNLVGTYEYTVQAYSSTNGTGTLLNAAKGVFNMPDMKMVAYHDIVPMIHFVGQPPASTKLRIFYRPEGSADDVEYKEAWAEYAGSNSFDWDTSYVPAGRYEYIYEAYDSANLLTNKAKGVLQLGASPSKVSHDRYYLPTLISFYVPNTNALGMDLYFKRAGSTGGYGDPVHLTRTDASKPFEWDASGDFAPNTTATIDYYYNLRDTEGHLLLVEGDPLTTADDTPIKVNGIAQVGEEALPDELQWIISGTADSSVTISRSQTYNAFGDVIEEKDGNGNIVNSSYNTLGALIQKQAPLTDITLENSAVVRERPTTTYTYDLAGRLIAVTDANNHTNTQSWLAGTGLGGLAGRVLVETHADGGQLRRGYDVFGDMRHSIDHVVAQNLDTQGFKTRYEYDAAGRLVTLTHASGAAVDKYEYDSLGNRIAHTNALLDRERMFYDGLGRVTKTISFGGLATSYGYTYSNDIFTIGGRQVGGYQKTTTLPDQHQSIERVDVFGHLSWSQDLGGHIYQYTYNNSGWLIKQTSSVGQNIEYEFYANGNIKSIHDLVLHNFTAYEYDRNGNRVRELYKQELGDDIHGWTGTWDYYQNAQIFYDELNRMKRVLDPRADIKYEYDAVGNRRRVLSVYNDGVNGKTARQDYWYVYDEMNRFVITMGTLVGGRAENAADSDSYIALGSTGVRIQYHASGSGERMSATYGEDSHVESYTYNKDGYLVDTFINGTLKTTRDNDLLGRVKKYTDKSDGTYWRTTVYDKDGRTLSEEDSDDAVTTYDYYDTSGNNNVGPLKSVKQVKDSMEIKSNYTYVWWDDAKQSRINAKADHDDLPDWTPGDSYFKYDVNGHIFQVDDPAGRQAGLSRTIRYVTNAQGLILERVEIAGGTLDAAGSIQYEKQRFPSLMQPKPASAPKSTETINGDVVLRHSFYYINGSRVGDVGNDGTELRSDKLSYAEELAQEPVEKKDYYKDWKAIKSADFDQNYQPINSNYPAATPGTYTVQAGDTFQTIAAKVWGDSAMWYLIADANGGVGTQDLAQNQVLVIPNKVTNIHNNSGTFKVYDAGQAIGDTSPTLPDPPPPKDGGCGGIGMIIMIIVVIVVAYFTGGALLATLQSALGPAAGAMATGAIAGAAGSVAGQLTGMALGIQDKFSWRDVATAAISGAVSGGIGNYASSNPGSLLASKGLEGFVSRAIVGNVLTQGIGVATGLQKKFSWTSVASAGIGSAVGWGVNELIGQAQYGQQWNLSQVEDIGSSIEDPKAVFDAWKNVTKDAGGLFARGFAASAANMGAQSLISGSKPNWAAIAVESFGQNLDSAIAARAIEKDKAMRASQAANEDDSIGWPDGSSFIKDFDMPLRNIPASIDNSKFIPGLAEKYVAGLYDFQFVSPTCSPGDEWVDTIGNGKQSASVVAAPNSKQSASVKSATAGLEITDGSHSMPPADIATILHSMSPEELARSKAMFADGANGGMGKYQLRRNVEDYPYALFQGYATQFSGVVPFYVVRQFKLDTAQAGIAADGAPFWVNPQLTPDENYALAMREMGLGAQKNSNITQQVWDKISGPNYNGIVNLTEPYTAARSEMMQRIANGPGSWQLFNNLENGWWAPKMIASAAFRNLIATDELAPPSLQVKAADSLRTEALFTLASFGLPLIKFRPGLAANRTNQLSEAFHYTGREWGTVIKTEGLRPGSYATPSGDLSGLAAKLELALPPIRSAPEMRMRIDLDGLRNAGFEIPTPTRVSGVVKGADGRVYTMPGGGLEMKFPYSVPGEFIEVLPIK